MPFTQFNKICDDLKLPLHIRWQAKYYFSKYKNEIITINFTCKILEHRLSSRFVLEHKENKSKDMLKKEVKLLNRIGNCVRNDINVLEEFVSFVKIVCRSKKFPAKYLSAIKKLDAMHENEKKVKCFGYGNERNERMQIYYSLLNETDKKRAVKFFRSF